ncbi:MAG: hypothetical protein CL946_10290, partial [Ectothiorhodospiraceae bacterium]|nr:hypothetical protein [Ectothiorhodospiraceae bacterium]
MKPLLLFFVILIATPPFTTAQRTFTVGDTVCYSLTARDSSGAIIDDWNISGEDATITLQDSYANSDTSERSWNGDPDGYSWARMYHNGIELDTISGNEFIVPKHLFVNGMAEVCLVHTFANGSYHTSPVGVTASPSHPFRQQLPENLKFTPDTLDNFLLDLIPPNDNKNNAVYKERTYEIRLIPRDRFLNLNEQEHAIRFEVRYPEEIWCYGFHINSDEVFWTSFGYILPFSKRSRILPDDSLQVIKVYHSSKPWISGTCDPYEILDHPPTPFRLESPPNHSILSVNSGVGTEDSLTWERPDPPDPYWGVRFRGRVYEKIKYTVVFLDSVSLIHELRYESDGDGVLPRLTYTDQLLNAIGDSIAKTTTWDSVNLVWYVEADDLTYITRSTPPSPENGHKGWHITLVRNPV